MKQKRLKMQMGVWAQSAAYRIFCRNSSFTCEFLIQLFVLPVHGETKKPQNIKKLTNKQTNKQTIKQETGGKKQQKKCYLV